MAGTLSTRAVRSETVDGRLRRAAAAALLFVVVAAGMLAPAGAAARPAGGAVAKASIIGGEAVEPGALPWLAFVVRQSGEAIYTCTGTVVAPDVVLTAAHCVVDMSSGRVASPSSVVVVTGTVDWTSPERQVSAVDRTAVYPAYRLHGRLAGWGDAALLFLATPTSAPAIRLAASADSPSWTPGTEAAIAGWGMTYFGQSEGPYVAQWATTVVQSGRWCERAARGFHSRGQLCTIDAPSDATSICHGDSGGPLLADRRGTNELIEIAVAQGVYGPCALRAPDVFTRADTIAPWVNRTLQEQNPPPPATGSVPYRYYVGCGLSASARPSHRCPSGSKKGAFFETAGESVLYTVCVSYPTGRRICARGQEAQPGTLYVNKITSNVVGLHEVSWFVNGQQVGSFSFRVSGR